MIDARAADLLAAVVCTDLDALSATSLLRDHAAKTLAELPARAWVDVISSAFPRDAYPGLTMAVQELIEQCDGSFYRVLREASLHFGDLGSRAGSRFPWDLVSGEATPAELHALPFDVADSHVHSGAILPLEGMIRLIASSPTAEGRAAVGAMGTYWSRAGRCWDVATLVVASRWVVLYLWLRSQGLDVRRTRVADSYQFSVPAVRAVISGGFWSALGTAAGGLATEDLVCAGGAMDQGLCPPVSYLVGWALDSDRRDERESLEVLVLGLLRALIGLRSHIFSKPGEGLSRFVTRFNEMRFIRDSPAELFEGAIGEAIRANVRDTRVVGMEFRSLALPKEDVSVGMKIRENLQSHVQAFEDYCGFTGRRLAFSVPVSLLRRPVEVVRRGATMAYEELAHSLQVFQGIEQVVNGDRSALLGDLIHSVDYVGEELGSSNWPLLMGYSTLSHDVQSRICLTSHAGESFSYPLNGLRRIGELFDGSVAPRRIGHALALSRTASSMISRSMMRSSTVADVLGDCAWLARTLETPAASKAARDVAHVLTRPGDCTGRSIDVDTLFEALGRLYDIQGTTELSLTYSSGGLWRESSPEMLVESMSEGGLVRAAAHFVLRLPPELAAFDAHRVLSESESAEVLKFSAEHWDLARAAVVSKLKAERVIIESCPTSNLVLAGMESVQDHPLWSWVDEGIAVSASTDDPLIFGTDIASEFLALRGTGHLRKVQQIARTSVRSCSGGSSRRWGKQEYTMCLNAVERMILT